VIIGPVPALIILLGVVLVYFYPITRTSHGQMVAALEARRAANETGHPTTPV